MVKRRACRRPLIYSFLRQWEAGELEELERAWLEIQGYGRWLERRKLTAPMIVELLLLLPYILGDELGERFLAENASMHYRAARVRKWRQLALRSDRLT